MDLIEEHRLGDIDRFLRLIRCFRRQHGIFGCPVLYYLLVFFEMLKEVFFGCSGFGVGLGISDSFFHGFTYRHVAG